MFILLFMLIYTITFCIGWEGQDLMWIFDEKKLRKSKIIISLEDLETGIYILQIYQENLLKSVKICVTE